MTNDKCTKQLKVNRGKKSEYRRSLDTLIATLTQNNILIVLSLLVILFRTKYLCVYG